jgi:hypothetical protein
MRKKAGRRREKSEMSGERRWAGERQGADGRRVAEGKESGRRRKVIGLGGGPEPVELPLQLT